MLHRNLSKISKSWELEAKKYVRGTEVQLMELKDPRIYHKMKKLSESMVNKMLMELMMLQKELKTLALSQQNLCELSCSIAEVYKPFYKSFENKRHRFIKF